ncbi:hypothetical protein [Nocardia arthritidis]|uniref:Tail assembly chaperone n=1 Tax=Nocardia arthritidis TaxID=228602 RepID=A0A6G9YUB9_9NOCA|nr:hypothetical protein [Nocardia arthritidis]QIS16596.1 hypothetical protein F5544_43965 [Nocardia arthritidis]
MATRKSSTAAEAVGRFFEIQQELSDRRRGPYQLTKDIVIQPMTRRQAIAMRDAEGDEEQLKILLGGQYEAIAALYDDRPFDEWVAFQRDLYAHFYGAGAAELPGGSSGS